MPGRGRNGGAGPRGGHGCPAGFEMEPNRSTDPLLFLWPVSSSAPLLRNNVFLTLEFNKTLNSSPGGNIFIITTTAGTWGGAIGMTAGSP